MTKVYLEHSGDAFSIRAKGHATGSEQVCAAVSCLLYTVAGWLRNQSNIGSASRLEDGDASIVFYDRGEARTAYDLARIGFLQIAAAYPDYLRVEADKP